jgi:hypothetical protein
LRKDDIIMSGFDKPLILRGQVKKRWKIELPSMVSYFCSLVESRMGKLLPMGAVCMNSA